MEKNTIKFIGMDEWDRAVFKSVEGQNFYKSVELMPHPYFINLSAEEKEMLLCSLHTTDEPDGEPGWPVSRENFTLVE